MSVGIILAFVVGLSVWGEAALAYLGPATGLGSLGALAAMMGAGAFIVVGFVWYPVKRIMRRFKRRRSAAVDAEQQQDAETQ